jgi:aspartate racemase
MKTIGLIGGTGWVSTLEYYRLINEETNRLLGGHNAARCILYSFNYADINECNLREDHEGVYKFVLDAARKLKNASADCLVLCANTLHQYADRIVEEVKLPIIHIADATAVEIKKQRLTVIGLLGTKFTMEMDFYTKRLSKAGISSIVPEKAERLFIHSTIMNELLKEIYKPESKQRFLEIINDLEQKGAQGIVLGCTEIPLLIKQTDTHLPVFNTLKIHAKAAVNFAVSDL